MTGSSGFFHVSFRLAVSDARVALPNFYNVAVRIANVAARLAVFGLWLGDELDPPAAAKCRERYHAPIGRSVTDFMAVQRRKGSLFLLRCMSPLMAQSGHVAR
jgi:hypothetical protein